MFYQKVKMLCEQNGIKIASLVRQLGMSSGSATHWKNGKIPKSDTVQKIADYFGVTTDFLLDNHNNDESLYPLSKNALTLIELFNKLDEDTQLKMIGRFEILALNSYSDGLDLLLALKDYGITSRDELDKAIKK